ncbi:hypothetical protein MLD38_003720 [Melastoma candidum]|uniref:Uncharacterized protein n=1 Tax=Melastoma candidum TaxID=119954 RepID=A0ACB9S2Z4_9MYRT|nr:hypothetical protein MLD38_003720 [Melastoma candidum]
MPGDVESCLLHCHCNNLCLLLWRNHKLVQVEEEQSNHAYSVVLATAVAAEAAVAAAQAAAEVIRLTSVAGYSGKSKEEIAAIKIQTVFRGYMVCFALFFPHKNLELIFSGKEGFTGIERACEVEDIHRRSICQETSCFDIEMHADPLEVAITGASEKDTDVRRKQTILRQFQHKQEKEVEKLRVKQLAGSWNDSAHSKEQMEANFLSKQEAAIRRERALAYPFSHQKTWKNSKSTNQMFMDPNNPQWGWSWLERCTVSQPWETRPTTTVSKAYDEVSLKSEGLTSATSFGQIDRSNSSRHNLKKPSSTAAKPTRAHSLHYSPSTPTSNDSRSLFSVQSEMMVRRHSIMGSSSVRDDESLTSTPTIPSYMAPTMSTKVKSRVPSLLRFFHNDETTTMQAGKPSVRSARKRLSFPCLPGGSGVGTRRLLGPPKVDSNISIIKGLVVETLSLLQLLVFIVGWVDLLVVSLLVCFVCVLITVLGLSSVVGIAT